MRVLITGISGFVGSHLAELCLKKGDEVYGAIRHRSNLETIEHIKNKVKLFECELTDLTNVKDMIDKVKPDKIFHLAAQSFVPTSWESPVDTLTNNIVSELNILEAVRELVPECKIQIAGSSEEYGNPISEPMTEDHPLNPLSPYGVSKVTQDKLACQYARSYGLKIVVTRGFNHTGPRRGAEFVCSTFAKQIAEGKKMKVGNLDAIRDFTDARDMVRAYYMALKSDKIEYGVPYNICSGKGIKIQNILDMLIEISGKKIKVEQDPDRMRPSDIHTLIGDCSKFRKITGWKPEITFGKTLRDIYNYWKLKINE